MVLGFRASADGVPGGSGRCGAEAGCDHSVGDDMKALSGLGSDCEEVPGLCERERRDPKREDDLEGVEDATGESPSSYIVVVVGVVNDEHVLVEDILGREGSLRESPGLRRASGTDADEKCPKTLGRHRHEEGVRGSSDDGAGGKSDV